MCERFMSTEWIYVSITPRIENFPCDKLLTVFPHMLFLFWYSLSPPSLFSPSRLSSIILHPFFYIPSLICPFPLLLCLFPSLIIVPLYYLRPPPLFFCLILDSSSPPPACILYEITEGLIICLCEKIQFCLQHILLFLFLPSSFCLIPSLFPFPIYNLLPFSSSPISFFPLRLLFSPPILLPVFPPRFL